MKSAKGHHEDEEDEYEEFGAKKDTPLSNTNRDGKNSDKASATRSKHSVTEQRRRSKINERFQILRDLIPNSDQKRDTASFLLEVIDYVQYLQEKVQKYEGSYQGWSPEPTKLMPWRNSHWRVQNFVGHPQAIKNDSGPGSTFSGRLDDNNVSITPSMHTIPQNPVETDPTRDALCKLMDQQPEQLANKTTVMPMPLQEELTIEGGTINISSVYSQGLLNTLTEALQNAGVDLSQATISVQVDLGKRANRGLTSGIPIAKDHENPESGNQPVGCFQDANNGDDSDRAQKRMKM